MSSATKLWILSLNYAPEPTGFAPHATALAVPRETWTQRDRGHGIPIRAAMGALARITPCLQQPGYREQGGRQTGFSLHSKTGWCDWQRVAMEASFCLAGAIVLAPKLLNRCDRPDAVLYIGAQPALAMLARWIGAVTRVPYFVNVNDLAAQAAADVGIVRSGWIQRLLERIEFAGYLPSAGASVLCQSFAEALIAKGYPADRIRVIRSPIDLDLIRPLPLAAEYREALGLPAGAFVYSSQEAWASNRTW